MRYSFLLFYLVFPISRGKLRSSLHNVHDLLSISELSHISIVLPSFLQLLSELLHALSASVLLPDIHTPTGQFDRLAYIKYGHLKHWSVPRLVPTLSIFSLISLIMNTSTFFFFFFLFLFFFLLRCFKPKLSTKS